MVPFLTIFFWLKKGIIEMRVWGLAWDLVESNIAQNWDS